jgi:hypothetical protein
MSTIDSSSAVDGARIRRQAARIVRERSPEYAELVTELQEQFDVSERTIRDELTRCFDARLLFPPDPSDDEEVRAP